MSDMNGMHVLHTCYASCRQLPQDCILELVLPESASNLPRIDHTDVSVDGIAQNVAANGSRTVSFAFAL